MSYLPKPLEMRKTVGIYSLSRTPYDELMWSHYGESHEGFCIEYDLERLIGADAVLRHVRIGI